MATPAGKLRVLVAVKRVIDWTVKPRVSADKKGVDLTNVKMSMNPFCEIATEEAVKMKDKGLASEVIVVSIGPKQAVDTLRTALAMGADRGIHLETSNRIDLDLPHLHTAAALAHIASKEKVDLVLAGKQSIDDDSALVPAMLAAILKRPQALCASSIQQAPPTAVTVACEVDGGSRSVKLALPAVVSSDLRLNTPRYATLPNIMKAKKKPIASLQLDAVLKEAGVDGGRQRVKVVEVREPKDRRAGVKVENVDELVDKLRSEAKVV